MPVAFTGAAGPAILFIFLAIFLFLVCLIVFAHGSNSFLVIVEQTSTGNDEVTWPDEPYYDWIFRLGVIAWLVLVWLAPLGIILKLVSRDIYTEEPLVAVLVACGLLWLVFPIGVLSSLVAGSHWAFLSPGALGLLSRKVATTLGFYLASAVLLALVLGSWAAAFLLTGWLIPVAAAVSAAAWLAYARLLGRLVWIVMGSKRKRKKKRSARDSTAPALGPLIMPKPQRHKKTGGDYDLAADSPPEETETPEPEPTATRYAVADDPDEEEREQKKAQNEFLADVESKVERGTARLAKTEPPKSLVEGVFTFPWYDKSMSAWLFQSAGLTLAGVVLLSLLDMSIG